jgi:hypothetical protein
MKNPQAIKLQHARKLLNRACIHLLLEFDADCEAMEDQGQAVPVPEDYGDSFDAALGILRSCREQVELDLAALKTAVTAQR